LGDRPTRHLTVAILVALGKTPFRAPRPVILANTVFKVRVAAVVQHKIVLVEPDFAQSAKLESS
jgi:hypothetical protein